MSARLGGSMRNACWTVLVFLVLSCSGVRSPIRPESMPESSPESTAAESKPTADSGAAYSAIGTAREVAVYDGIYLDSGFKCGSVDATRRVEAIRVAMLAVVSRLRDLEAAAPKGARTAAEADAARFTAASNEFALVCRDEATICESDRAEVACYSAISALLFVAELYAEALTAPLLR